jgi:hypothetical protein
MRDGGVHVIQRSAHLRRVVVSDETGDAAHG